jgi:GT2 family glycosyltransferase
MSENQQRREKSTLSGYVLITPARNEAQFIELTINSVIRQTVTPLRWVIVSDGSTDGTDDIVQRYVERHPWIELVRLAPGGDRNFARKVVAFNAGYCRVSDLNYEMIGSLDADISFDENYFAFLLEKLAVDCKLGLVGTPFVDRSVYDYRFSSIEHVSGACQLFRRECFESIGGYRPVTMGGIDLIAVLSARMNGWKTRTFTGKTCIHHRPIGSAKAGHLTAKFRVGILDYALGGHPVWELFRVGYQMTRKPYIVGGLLLFGGYAYATVRRVERPVPPDLVRFRRAEQLQRLKEFLTNTIALQSRFLSIGLLLSHSPLMLA